MPSFNYDRTKATATRLITRYGQTAVLKHSNTSGPAYDPVISGPVTHNVTIVVTGYSNYEIGQGRVLASDKKVMMAATGVEPQYTDKLAIGGVDHSIIGPDEGNGIKPLAPGGVVVMYELQCRR